MLETVEKEVCVYVWVTWYSVRMLDWLCVSVQSRKDLSRGCGYDASWARIPVTNRFTAMEFSRRFSSRDNNTLMKGPVASWEITG